MQYVGPSVVLDECELLLRTPGRMLVVKASTLSPTRGSSPYLVVQYHLGR